MRTLTPVQFQEESAVIETWVEGSAFHMNFRGGILSKQLPKNVYLFCQRALKYIHEQKYADVYIHLEELQAIADPGKKAVQDAMLMLATDSYFQFQTLHLTYASTQTNLKPFFDNVIQQLPELETIQPVIREDFSLANHSKQTAVALCGLEDRMAEELSYLFLMNGAEVLTPFTLEQMERLFFLNYLSFIIINPIRIIGHKTKDILTWINQLPLVYHPKIVLLSNEDMEEPLRPNIHQVPVINLGNTIVELGEIGSEIIKKRLEETKDKRQHVRVAVNPHEPIRMVIELPKDNVTIETKIHNISMGGGLIEIARPILASVLKLGSTYPHTHMTMCKQTVKTGIIPVVQKEHFFGVKFVDTSEESKHILATYILEQMNTDIE